ncbi:MAG TPA: class I SAM-dependent methyltransferase [Methylomirabilota bacterium]|jgi:SAM-dependent methyltransferase|nr:class I SAM-dependent methyltransferase [Methylomirabilota bacterium]
MEPHEYARSFAFERDHWWFRAKRALVLGLLGRYGWADGWGLDLGCGTGGMLETLTDRGTWVGVDAESLALDFSRKRGLARLVEASATGLPFRAGTFDACLCLDVLYHRGVASDQGALAECHRVLRQGGLLIVTDSAFAWLRSRHDDAVHGRRRYTRRQLVEQVRAAGFTPILASYTYCLVFPVVAAVRLLRRLQPGGPQGRSDVFPLPAVLTGALLVIQAVERALLRLTPLPFGSSVLCVARKGAGGRT